MQIMVRPIQSEGAWEEEWDKLPKSRCSKLVERKKTVITAKGASTKHWFESTDYTDKRDPSFDFY